MPRPLVTEKLFLTPFHFQCGKMKIPKRWKVLSGGLHLQKGFNGGLFTSFENRENADETIYNTTSCHTGRSPSL